MIGPMDALDDGPPGDRLVAEGGDRCGHEGIADWGRDLGQDGGHGNTHEGSEFAQHECDIGPGDQFVYPPQAVQADGDHGQTHDHGGDGHAV